MHKSGGGLLENLPFHHVGAGYMPHVSGLPASAFTGWALSPALRTSFKRRIAVKHRLMCYT